MVSSPGIGDNSMATVTAGITALSKTILGTTTRKHALALAVAGVLTGCGGGGGGGSDTSPVTGGTGSAAQVSATSKPVAVFGQIDTFGSVVVNGVHYDTDNAVITVNGEAVVETDLEVGYLVRITGERDEETGEGVATLIEYASEVLGPIESIDIDAGTIKVLGQTITFNDETEWVDDDLASSITDLVEGLLVEVSGFRTDTGVIVAAHIEISEDSDELVIAGDITAIDLDNSTVTINEQVIDLSQLANSEVDLSSLAVGDRVAFFGELVDGVFQALEGEDDLDFDFDTDGEEELEAEFEGLITGLTDNLEFTLNGLPTVIDDDTEFEFGSRDDLREGMFVEVEGEFNDGGQLIIDELRFHRAMEIEFAGIVEAIDPDTNSFTVNGLTFTVTEDTRFEDDSDVDERQFTLEDIAAGDFLFVEGFYEESETDEETDVEEISERLIAKHIERHNVEDEEEFEFEFSDDIVSFDGTEIELENGTVILLDEDTEWGEDFEFDLTIDEDNPLPVEIEGHFEGGVFIADSIEIESFDDDCESSQSFEQSSSFESENGTVSISLFVTFDAHALCEDEFEDDLDDDLGDDLGDDDEDLLEEDDSLEDEEQENDLDETDNGEETDAVNQS